MVFRKHKFNSSLGILVESSQHTTFNASGLQTFHPKLRDASLVAEKNLWWSLAKFGVERLDTNSMFWQYILHISSLFHPLEDPYQAGPSDVAQQPSTLEPPPPAPVENSPQLPQSDGEFDLVSTENSERSPLHSCILYKIIWDDGFEADAERARA